MSLARAWRRQLLGASGMAVLAPAATIVAIALLAFAGGFAHLGGLGQAFNGPTLPSSTVRAGGAAAGTHDLRRGSQVSGLGATLLLASTTGAGRAAAGGGAGASGPGSAGPPGGGNGRPGPGGHHFTGGPQPVPGGGGGKPPPPSSNPPPNPPPQQTLVDGVVTVGTSVTSKLPGPVGPAATQALQAVGQTVDKILPPPPSAKPPVVSGGLLGGVHVP